MNDTLQENEKWYRSLLDQAADAFHILDVEGRIVDVNAPMCESLGYTREELMGMRTWELDPSWTQERYTEVFSALPVGAPFTIEAIHYRKDGSTFPVEARNVKVVLNGSELSATFARDISDRKQAEERLRENQQTLLVFRNLADNALDAILLSSMVAGQAQITYANRACHEIFGYDYETQEMIGLPGHVTWPEEDLPFFAETVAPHVVAGGWTGDVRQKRKDGTRLETNVTAFVMRDAEGAPTTAVTFIRDISERKRAEEEQERLQQEVIEAQRQALRELSTPIIPVMEGIIVMPLVGSIDTMRSKDIMRTLMQGISAYRAKVVILDITGVPLVDSGVADHLNKTIQAARLKGTRTIVTGVSDAVAETIVDLGIDWGDIETLRDLQTGLVVALGSLGFKLSGAGSL